MNKKFICEICHCKTPIECEGSEPNTCADCMPIRDDLPRMINNTKTLIMCDLLMQEITRMDKNGTN